MTTTQPSNSSELQLYRVLQKANLLQYYDTFIAQGGDDVQQLCEAGEEEFLEIMALVGMASKPLHVRRLQKALQEWVTSPHKSTFQSSSALSPSPGSISAVIRDQIPYTAPPSSSHTTSTGVINVTTWMPQPSVSPANSAGSSSARVSPSPEFKDLLTEMCRNAVKSEPLFLPRKHSTSPGLPSLHPDQIAAIAESAHKLAKELPSFLPKVLNLKKPINREIQTVMSLPEEDPLRLEKLRKYAAIYGRFDSKRKNDKPMSLHEISVNEAAAQLCWHIPTLLTRREDLFPIARQVVRDSGYQYSKGHSRASTVEEPPAKKVKWEALFQRVHAADPTAIKEEIDKIQIEIQDARDKGDMNTVHELQPLIEMATVRQLQLLAEGAEGRLKLPTTPNRYDMKTGNGICDPDDVDDPDSSPMHSGGSSPQGDAPDDALSAYTARALLQVSRGGQNNDNTLYDEGLRIAQQYGMADFAEELKELQHQRADEDEDEEEEDPGVEVVEGDEKEITEVNHNTQQDNGLNEVPVAE